MSKKSLIDAICGDSSFESLSVGKLGNKKESLYRAELFADCTTKEDVKSVRNQIRKELDIHRNNFIVSVKSKKADWIESTVTNFLAFYAKTYNRNDFTVESVCDVKKKLSAFGGQNWINQVTKLLDFAKEWTINE